MRLILDDASAVDSLLLRAVLVVDLLAGGVAESLGVIESPRDAVGARALEQAAVGGVRTGAWRWDALAVVCRRRIDPSLNCPHDRGDFQQTRRS